jgi:hypothetical protein
MIGQVHHSAGSLSPSPSAKGLSAGTAMDLGKSMLDA